MHLCHHGVFKKKNKKNPDILDDQEVIENADVEGFLKVFEKLKRN